jgi:hypothetical protein
MTTTTTTTAIETKNASQQLVELVERFVVDFDSLRMSYEILKHKAEDEGLSQEILDGLIREAMKSRGLNRHQIRYRMGLLVDRRRTPMRKITRNDDKNVLVDGRQIVTDLVEGSSSIPQHEVETTELVQVTTTTSTSSQELPSPAPQEQQQDVDADDELTKEKGFDNTAKMKILELEARNYELEYMLSHQKQLATSNSGPSQQQPHEGHNLKVRIEELEYMLSQQRQQHEDEQKYSATTLILEEIKLQVIREAFSEQSRNRILTQPSYTLIGRHIEGNVYEAMRADDMTSLEG